MSVDIAEWAQSKYGFYVDRHWQGGKWVLERGPIVLAEYHKRLLRHIFTPDESGRLPYDVVAWAEPAKSGKSAIAGLCAEYVALHLDGDVIMASNKQNQAASLMFKSLTDSIQWNPHLPNVQPNRYEVAFASGNTVRAIPSNYRGEAGARFALFALDEPWGVIYRDGVRLWSEFKHDPTRQSSLKLAIGYAGYIGESKLWEEQLKRGLAGEPVPELEDLGDGRGEPACWRNGRHFTFWSHQTRQPWQTPEWIESQRKSLRAAEFARMIGCDFAEGEGDFIEQEAWEACIDPEHKPLPPGSPFPVFVGLDLATAPKGDDCACVGLYPEDRKVKLAFHKVWKGRARRQRLKLGETVLPFLLDVRKRYRLKGVWFDPYQGLFLSDELRRAGVRCWEVAQTHGSRGPKDTALYEFVANRQLVLYPHPEIERAAAGANAKELGNGLIFLAKAGGRAKIDLLVAMSNAADEVMRPTGVFVGGGPTPEQSGRHREREREDRRRLDDAGLMPSGYGSGSPWRWGE